MRVASWVLDGLESAFVELHANGIGVFRFDGIVDEFLGYLRNVGGTDKDDFPVILGADTVNVRLFARYGCLDFFRLGIRFVHTVDVM